MRYHEDSFERDGGRIFHRSWRPEGESRDVVVIVHGFGEHGGRYPHLVEALVSRGFEVWAMDHRGHGRSFGKRGHVDRWTDYTGDLGAFLDLVRDRAGNLPLFLLGHSMGGLVTINYVLENARDITGVILSGPALTQGAVSPALIAISRVLSRLWPTFSVDTGMEEDAVSRDRAVVQAYANDPFVHSLATARMGTEMARAIRDAMDGAGKWRLPLLLVQGGDDRLIPPEYSREFFSRIRSEDRTHKEYDGYYHETHNDLGWERPVSDMAAWIEERMPKT
ncbi:MAG: lysophospholipase [Desulfatibacillaceae bacterium]